MTTLARPAKQQYGTTSYAGEVAAAGPGKDVPILATDVDADLDLLYGNTLWTTGAARIAEFDAPTLVPLDPLKSLQVPVDRHLVFQGQQFASWIVNANNGSPWLVLGRNGCIGIGDPNDGRDPTESLTTWGGIRLGPFGAVNTDPATLPGTIQFDGTHFEGYTPSGWRQLDNAPGGSAAGVTFPVRALTGSATLTAADGLIVVDTTTASDYFILTLPAAASCGGRQIKVATMGQAGVVKIVPASGDTLLKQIAPVAVYMPGGHAEVVSDGTRWFVMDA